MPPMPTNATTTVDLDHLLGLVVKEKQRTKKIKMFGRTWTVICDLNSFAMAQIAGGDSGGISKFMLGLVDEDEKEDFAEALSSAKGLDGEKLGALLTKLIEVAGERPTEQPSPSPRTAKKQTSTLRSADS